MVQIPIIKIWIGANGRYESRWIQICITKEHSHKTVMELIKIRENKTLLVGHCTCCSYETTDGQDGVGSGILPPRSDGPGCCHRLYWLQHFLPCQTLLQGNFLFVFAYTFLFKATYFLLYSITDWKVFTGTYQTIPLRSWALLLYFHNIPVPVRYFRKSFTGTLILNATYAIQC